MTIARNNSRKVAVIDEVLNVPLKIRGGRYHLLINIILDGNTPKVDVRNWINDNGRLFPTSKGLRLTFLDLFTIRELEVSRRSLFLNFFKGNKEFIVDTGTGEDKLKGSVIYDVIDNEVVYDIRRCYIHNVTGNLKETSRGLKLTEGDIFQLKVESEKQGYDYDLIGLITSHLRASFRNNAHVA